MKKKQNMTSTQKTIVVSALKKHLPLIGLIVLIIILRFQFLQMPFERDEGAYSYYGQLVLEGKIPYIDFYDQKFPGIFYFYALIVFIFGRTVVGMHLGFILINVITVVIIFRLGEKLFDRWAGWICAAGFGILSLTPDLSGFTVQSEHAVALFASAALLTMVYAIQTENGRLWFLSGLLLGCAFMVKTSGVFFVVAGGCSLSAVLYLKHRLDLRRWWRPVLLMGSGVLTVVALLFFLIVLQGAFNEMMYWAYRIPKNYVSKISWAEGKGYLAYHFKAITGHFAVLWLCGALGLVVLAHRSITGAHKILVWTFAVFSIATIFPGFYFYGHYWIQVLPLLSLLIGAFYFVITILLSKWIKEKTGRSAATCTLFILVLLAHVWQKQDYYFKPDYTRILRQVYGMNPFPEAMAIGEFIARQSNPQDQMIVIGSEPELYFYTQCRCPSQHAYFSALVDNVPEHRQWQQEFIRDVEKAQPRFIVFFDHVISLLVQANTDQTIFQWGSKYLNKHYHLIGVVDTLGPLDIRYLWGQDFVNYQVAGQFQIYIFARNS